jgi:Protein kinase domain
MTDRVIARRYRLGRRIGAGGMGRVWLAVDEVLRREVAVKEVILPDGLTEDDANDLHMRTLREAQTAAALSHPNVIKIFDVIYADERPWIVMEYVKSRSLAQVIKEDGPMSPEDAAGIGLCILEALVAAHDAGVLHRDVKPGNVLLGADRRVVLTDFGLATFDDIGSALTASGVVHGSPQYIAPERALDGTSTAAADMWSLGATLYAAVEGRAPYARASSYATLTALATAPPDPPRHAGALKPVLGGLLRRNPASRLKPDEIRAWLQQIASAVPPRSHVVPRQRKRSEADAPPPPVTGPAPGGGAAANGAAGGGAAGNSAAGGGASGNGASGNGAGGPAVSPRPDPNARQSARNSRPFTTEPGQRREPPAVAATRTKPVARPFDMPVAGGPPPAAVAGRPKSTAIAGAQAAFAFPDVEIEPDTDHQMDLAWQLDAAAGILGDRTADATRPRRSDAVGRRRRARRARWVIATIGLVVVATAGAFVVRQIYPKHASGHASKPLTSPLTGASTPPGAPVTASTATGPAYAAALTCPIRPTSSLSGLRTVAPGGPTTIKDNMGPPSGYRWFTVPGTGPDGITGAVPIGWRESDSTHATCLYDPNNSAHVFGIYYWQPKTTDPATELAAQITALRKAGKLPPKYTVVVPLVDNPDQPGTANLEFTFTMTVDGQTTKFHTMMQTSISAMGTAYATSSTETEFSWSTEILTANTQALSFYFANG